MRGLRDADGAALSRRPLVRDGHSAKWEIALDGLNETEKGFIRSRLQSRKVGRRRPLFHQGEASESLILIEEGRVRLFQTSEAGREYSIGVCYAGAILGLAALVLQRPRILSAESVDRVTISVMSRAAFQHCLQSVPLFAANVTRLLAILAVESIERSGPLAWDDASVRLGEILTSLALPDRSDPRKRRLRVEGLTHDDLAKMVGVGRTWVAQTLGRFERRGLISKGRGRITIDDPRRFTTFIAAERERVSTTARQGGLG